MFGSKHLRLGVRGLGYELYKLSSGRNVLTGKRGVKEIVPAVEYGKGLAS